MESPAGQDVKRRGILMTGESGIFTPEDVAFVQAVGAWVGEREGGREGCSAPSMQGLPDIWSWE
jgi:hypothetical protein